MQIYVKQCEIMQKNQWKGPNFQIQCFIRGRLELLAKNKENKEDLNAYYLKFWTGMTYPG